MSAQCPTPAAAAAPPAAPSRLVVLSPPASVPKEAATLNRLFAHGLQCYHARKPGCTEAGMRKLLQGVEPAYHPRIRLHHHHQLAQEFGVGGIHHPEYALPPLPLQPCIMNGEQGGSKGNMQGPTPPSPHQPHTSNGRRLLQSTSLHTLDQLEAAKGRQYGALDYAFLSPIFDSTSKKGYAAAKFDPVHLKALLQQQQQHGCELPIIALGGITPDTCAHALGMGFQGVAVLGGIWEADDPVAVLEQLLHKLQSTTGQ